MGSFPTTGNPKQRTMSTALAALIVGLLLWSELSPRARAAGDQPEFATDILPLFRAKCLRCHGGAARKADLDLSTFAGVRKGGETGPVIVPGDPEKSLLYEKVHDGAMPPAKKDRLVEAEVALIRRWIEAGAPATGQADAVESSATLDDVLPILLRRCTICHGRQQREAGLDLRSRAGILRGGKSGPVIVPGKPEESLLIRKVRSGQMPPLRRLIEVSIKPVEPAEVAVLARWIERGAPDRTRQPDVATTTPDPLVTDKDRDFWAFKPPRPVPPPVVRNPVRNPIDAFILKQLEAKGLAFAPAADRVTVLRRVCLDLTGLPPEPAEVRTFLADAAPDAYEKLVDRLLASPRYGERWGRHWLDLAGYADSEGKREQDQPRPFAWRYRDYVLRSFNADKPYDRFLLEQLAGDELADYEHAPEITPELADNLVATGFLRMAPDPTWFNLTNFVPDRLDVIADQVDVLGSAVLGLTMKCARCHSHKFDPIPHRDYYRLLDVFKGAFDEHDWMKSNWHPGLSSGPRTDRDLPFVATAERRQWQAHEAALRQEIDAVKAEKTSPDREKRLKELEARRLPEPKVRALWDRGEPSPTYIYRRGDFLSPARLVGPGVPSALTDGKTPFDVKPPWPGAKSTGRRLAFARWLTRPDHPLTARVLVNRIWRHHFGSGLVKTLDNFGKAGARPSHPELLDWLACEFVRRGWSLKAMHRLMVTSATYRESSSVRPELERLDPDNALCGRMPLQRMSAEQLYDAMLLVAGRLDEGRYGPPDNVEVRADGLVTPVGTARGWRRGVYLRQQRKIVVTHLEAFDFPQMNPNCIDRRDTTIAPQALHLMNNGMVHRLADAFARRVEQEAGKDPTRQIEHVYLIALGRPPTAEERALAQTALVDFTARWSRQANPEPSRQALTTYCHAILNSAAFIYID